MTARLHAILADIRRCSEACLPHPPRPVVRAASSAKIIIIGQAPGSKVHESGVPWQDQSGSRLREWTGLDETTFYDASRVALMPMGFCYPGAADGADLPPRPECARLGTHVPSKARLTLSRPHSRPDLLPAGSCEGDNDRDRRALRGVW